MSLYGFENIEPVAKLVSMATQPPELIYLVMDALLSAVLLLIVITLYVKFKKRKQANIQQQPQQAPQSKYESYYREEEQKRDFNRQNLQQEISQGLQPRRIGKWTQDDQSLVLPAQQTGNQQLDDGLVIKSINKNMEINESLPQEQFEITQKQFYWKEKENILWLITGLASLTIFFFIK